MRPYFFFIRLWRDRREIWAFFYVKKGNGIVGLTIETNPQGIQEACLTWRKETVELSKMLASPNASLTMPLDQNGIGRHRLADGLASKKIISLYL